MTDNEWIYRTRQGLGVKRCHTRPWIGEYTNGHHTANALALLFRLWRPQSWHPFNKPPIILVEHLLMHDVHEGTIGDLPANARWAAPELNERYKLAAHQLDQEMDVPWFQHLGDEVIKPAYSWLQGVDKLELWIACCEQVKLGNQFAHEILTNLEPWFEETDLPEEVYKFWRNYTMPQHGE